MTDVIVRIMVEVLSILAIMTTEIKQRRRGELIADNFGLLADLRLEKYLKKLLGRNDVEDALKRLDTLTQEEAQMAIVEVLKVTRNVDDKVDVLIDGTQSVSLFQHGVPTSHLSRRQRSRNQSRRREAFVISSSRCRCFLCRSFLQVSNYGEPFANGFLLPISRQITISPAKLTTREPLPGSSRVVLSRSGSLILLSYGFMGNVRSVTIHFASYGLLSL